MAGQSAPEKSQCRAFGQSKDWPKGKSYLLAYCRFTLWQKELQAFKGSPGEMPFIGINGCRICNNLNRKSTCFPSALQGVERGRKK